MLFSCSDDLRVSEETQRYLVLSILRDASILIIAHYDNSWLVADTPPHFKKLWRNYWMPDDPLS